MANITRIMANYENLLGRRRTWDTIWQDIVDYILTNRNDVFHAGSDRPSQKKTPAKFDSTAINANTRLAAAMQANLTNNVVRWFTLKARNPELNDDSEVARWLEDSSRRVYLAIQQSNFSSQVLEFYSDIGSLGTAIMLVKKKPNQRGFMFKTYPVSACVIQENEEERIDVIYVKFRKPVIVAAKMWGEKNLSDKSQELLKDKPYEMIDMIHFVGPRRTIDPGNFDPAAPPKRMPYESIIIDLNGKDGKEVNESGFPEFPYMVSRWSKAPGNEYGESPGMIALPDVKTLNKVKELGLKKLQQVLFPPLQVRDRGVVGRTKMSPGSLNSVRAIGDIAPIDTGGDFNIAQFKEEDLKNSIRSIFFTDQLEFPPKQGTPISATEAGIRFDLMQRLLAPTLGRLQAEFQSPLINRMLLEMLRGGELADMPDILEGKEVDIEFEGALSVTQRAIAGDTLRRFISDAAPIIELVPESLDNIDADKYMEIVADVNNVPADLLKPREQVAAVREGRMEAQEEQNQQQELSEGAAALGKLAPLLKLNQGVPAA